VTLSVATTQPGITIPADALGVSYETSRMLPDENGVTIFADNLPWSTSSRRWASRIFARAVTRRRAQVSRAGREDVISFFEFAGRGVK
jgi:hypothetical protein